MHSLQGIVKRSIVLGLALVTALRRRNRAIHGPGHGKFHQFPNR